MISFVHIHPNPKCHGIKIKIACSAGGFGGFDLLIFRAFSRHSGFAADWENFKMAA